jgi:hypothetical protein
MAYYALLNAQNLVTEVFSGKDPGQDRVADWAAYYAKVRNQKCLQTSYTGSIRKNFASVGFTYDQTRDAFISPRPKPAEYYTLDEQSCQWVMTPAGMLAITTEAIKSHFDQVANQRQYDNLLTVDTYKGSNVPQWAAEHAAFFAWRDQCWLIAYQIQADVAAGLRPVPTPEQVISELPVLVWPS